MLKIWSLKSYGTKNPICGEGKDNAIPAHAMKACGGRRAVPPLILNIGSRWG